jgi:ATP-dependent DNA helicase RecQ
MTEIASDLPLESVLNSVWGYHHFRPQQEEIIRYVLSGNDALVIMPTGGGKSLCYQVPALLLPGITVVVSPLIALMNDQVQALLQSGVKVLAIHSNMDKAAVMQAESALLTGSVKLLYVSPERVNTIAFMEMLKRLKVSLFAIDEAHCVSIWGNDFRPDYVELSKVRDAFPEVPFIALTATADAATQEDITKQLHLNAARKFISSFERKNIVTIAKPAQNRYRQILDFLKKSHGESGIIYCLSRKETQNLADKLRSSGFQCAYYHAGMDARSRTTVQKDFQDDRLQFICATIAFGMGIDKSNIRWIIHHAMPKNLEGYYQEIGRCGRDGRPAKALLFYSWGDYLTLKGFIDKSEAPEVFRTVQYAKLERMWAFANAADCRTNMVLSYFGEYRNEACGHCDNCLDPPKSMDATLIAQKALSAIKRTRENVGMNMLIDILRGSGKAEILAEGYDRIKTFGAGREFSFIEWKVYITQLINKGLIRTDYTDHFKLKCTPLSDDVLFQNKKVHLVQFTQNPDVAVPEMKKPVAAKTEDGLLQELKKWRSAIATEKSIPAYVIFHDKTLEMLADKVPLFLSELDGIEGIGTAKKSQYGRQILSVIRSFILNAPHTKQLKGKSYIETLQLHDRGMNADEIARHRDITLGTVFTHLLRLYEQDEMLDIHRYINPDELEMIEQAWLKSGKAMALAVIAEHTTIPVDFNKMRLALAVILKKLKDT